MSIVHIIKPSDNLLPLYAKSINGHNSVPLASRTFTATPATPIPHFPVSGFLYAGDVYTTQPTSVTFSTVFLGGILGVTTVRICSGDELTDYFSAVIPVNGVSNLVQVPLTQLVNLPSSAVPLQVYIASDATSNSSFSPLCLEFVY